MEEQQQAGALEGGMMMEKIRSIGDWESKAVLFLYLRCSVAAAAIKENGTLTNFVIQTIKVCTKTMY